MTPEDIERKRRMAMLLMQGQPQQQAQMVGGQYIAPSPLSGLANMGTQLAGALAMRGADKAQTQYDTDRRSELAKSLSGLTGTGMGPQVGVDPQRQAAAAALGRMPLPELEATVGQMSAQALAPQKPQDLIKVGTGDSLYDPNSREMIHQGSPKLARLVDVIGPDGKPIKVREDQAEGMTPYRPSGVTVNTGDNGYKYGAVPQGYYLDESDPRNPRMTAIPGGPEDTSAEDALKEQNQSRQKGIVIEDIDRSLDEIVTDDSFLPKTGFLGDLTKNIGGTGAHALNNMLTTIKSNIGFDRLQQMRDESPTGGALGQVSTYEISNLQAVLGSLQQSQQPEELIFNLVRLRNMYNDVIHGPPEKGGPPHIDPQQVMQRMSQSAAEPTAGPDVASNDGWVTLPGGARIRPIPETN